MALLISHGRVLLFIFLTAGLLLTVLSHVMAEQASYSASNVKAAYIINFLNFISWPKGKAPADESGKEICVIGEDLIGPSLAYLAEQNKKNPISVARKSLGESFDSCNILFVSDSEKHRLKKILNEAQQSYAITVSDIAQFINNGGMIGFVIINKKVKFEINMHAVLQRNITISSKMLNVAGRVIR